MIFVSGHAFLYSGVAVICILWEYKVYFVALISLWIHRKFTLECLGLILLFKQVMFFPYRTAIKRLADRNLAQRQMHQPQPAGFDEGPSSILEEDEELCGSIAQGISSQTSNSPSYHTHQPYSTSTVEFTTQSTSQSCNTQSFEPTKRNPYPVMPRYCM